MDGWAILALLIALILIAFVFVYLVGKWKQDDANAYIKRITAEQQYDAALIKEAKVLIVGKMAFITKGVKGTSIIYDERPIDDTGTPITGSVIDGNKVTLHQLASALVHDSINSRGSDGTKLLTADEWKALGHEHEEHKAALGHLMQLGITKVQGGKSDSQGTYVKKGETLQTLMRDLAVYALPLATGQRIDKPQS